MIIAIDGPAASGKSTVAKEVAKRLGFKYVDTGAMYRAVTWKALKERIDITNEDALAALARSAQIEMDGLDASQHLIVRIDGDDVTEAIRTPKVSAAVSTVSKVPALRSALIKKQRSFADSYPDLVMDGRDIGTVVFSDAEVKVFLKASAVERAKRRYRELKEKGHAIDLSTVERDIVTRDKIDSTRTTGPLAKAPDARAIDTTNKTIGQVVQEIVDLVKKQKEKQKE
ncbi:MAG: cytidylate kinase [Candidatus Aquicultor secundus]|uniref:Cytidylate kinase n=1 Tax=Candidatus Aquicultor secundus TaxID=1973895 RepID=A0A2M7T7F7_9ACTN|nr:(d)CMP kinase [Candidatus Aquicultor secundus]NCO65748.1 (d)CMP kinase [Solirubrobacter sp.]OIO87817.1 MAG: cytidylate kinase [Candidatus Aquicultor secundus]PIU26781.1 MAG: cytidylate kinase [Candidatus Aquicultor secundus]PIX52092.1 MAG: cytidylate kinase [Candidatus Aquicultor secundus]PIZ38188.1 MAG: cytidylate kinase [Candidatus Aquicultor secundus]